MNIEELDSLAAWTTETVDLLIPKYQGVHSVLNHNATQPNKQPLEPKIEELRSALMGINVNSLTMSQSELLGEFDILQYLGERGLGFIDEVLNLEGIDPATAAKKFQTAIGSMNNAKNRSNSITTAFDGLELAELEPYSFDPEKIRMRVEFQHDASINNIVDLKDWSENWHQIVRGICLAIGEAPESVEVIGAARGSILLDLAVTRVFAKLLTSMLSEFIRCAQEVSQLQITRQELRRQKLLNDQLESGLNASIEERKADAIERVTKNAIENAPKDLTGEDKTALGRAINRLIDFHIKGGGLDVMPPQIEEHEDEESSVEYQERLELKESVEKIRSERETLRLPESWNERDDSVGDE